MEPDAIGLLAVDACAKQNEYDINLGIAIDILSGYNVTIFLDIGYWTLSNDDDAVAVAKIVNGVDRDEKCTGIALSTANYRTVEEMNENCLRYRTASGRNASCVVDCARNHGPPSSQNEWCNFRDAGIGQVPTLDTGYDALHALMWTKPPK